MPFSSFVRMCAKHLAMERTPLIKLPELERQLVCMGQGEPAGFVYPIDIVLEQMLELVSFQPILHTSPAANKKIVI